VVEHPVGLVLRDGAANRMGDISGRPRPYLVKYLKPVAGLPNIGCRIGPKLCGFLGCGLKTHRDVHPFLIGRGPVGLVPYTEMKSKHQMFHRSGGTVPEYSGFGHVLWTYTSGRSDCSEYCLG
jgi:hypothetical protein